jgi:hypothetical protein
MSNPNVRYLRTSADLRFRGSAYSNPDRARRLGGRWPACGPFVSCVVSIARAARHQRARDRRARAGARQRLDLRAPRPRHRRRRDRRRQTGASRTWAREMRGMEGPSLAPGPPEVGGSLRPAPVLPSMSYPPPAQRTVTRKVRSNRTRHRVVARCHHEAAAAPATSVYPPLDAGSSPPVPFGMFGVGVCV